MVPSLLSTKLYIPPARTSAIARPRLTEKLLSAVKQAGSFTLLSGPAGFGKTTLLSEFADRYQKPIAWLSLDEADNDPIRFWTYLIAACQSAQAGVGETALAMLQSHQMLPEDLAPTILINDLVGLGNGLVLVLDDYHAIHDQSIHSALAFLLDHLPDTLHLILSTRVDPPWSLARFRARNQLIEIRAKDLRFTTEEAAEFLSGVMGLSLTAADVAALEARTEGWIAGLQLAALSMTGRSDLHAFVKAFTGSNVYVAEYLVEEVLRHQPEEIQTFLLQTSILERLNASLCEFVTERPDGQNTLVGLQRSNLFVIALDDEGGWFRYHHLFSDLLQARLRQVQTAEEITNLHKQAASWYEQNGFAIEAVNHALAAKDFDCAARLVEENTYPLVTRGELNTLTRWIDALPIEVNHRPRFLLAKAWALLFMGDTTQIESLLGLMQAQIEASSEPPAPELVGGAAAIRAFFALMAGKHSLALDLARQAESILPPVDDERSQLNPYVYSAHSVLPYTLGMAYRSKGQYEQAIQAFEQEIRMHNAPSDILIWTIATIEVAVVRRLQGRLGESEEICRDALHRIDELGAYPYGSLARAEATLSEVLREKNLLEEALRRVISAIDRMRTWNMPTDRLAAYLTLGRIQISAGDLNGVHETIRLAKELRDSQPVFLDLSRTLDMLEIRMALAERDIPLADRLLQKMQPGTSRIVFLRQQELVLSAQVYLAQGKPTEAVASLTPLIRETETDGGMYVWLAALVQQMLALDALGKRKAALAVLAQALAFGEHGGFIRVFIDEGESMRKFLAAAARTAEAAQYADYINHLLEAFQDRPISGAAPLPTQNVGGLVEPLTDREREVLKLIAAGDSNQTIANKLVVTVSAVKKHTGNIFGKLSVNSRTQAIARARQLGLLSTDE